MIPVAFVDRDGTLIEEPPDEQVDAYDKVRFVPGVFAALQALRAHGYRVVMVTNQDGLGTDAFPRESFEGPHRWMVDAFASQGIDFDDTLVCPHRPGDGCACRKPGTRLVDEYLQHKGDVDLARSVVVGDRDSDLALAAALGVRGHRIGASPECSWPAVAHAILARRAEVERSTRETEVRVQVDLDATSPLEVKTGLGFFDHMLEQLAKHGGFSLRLQCTGDLQVDEHHTVEDCALCLGEALRRALGDKRGVGRYGFVVPMDEAQARVALDLSGRPYARFDGRFGREVVGALPTELVPHFFRSLAEGLGAALHVEVHGDNSHHMIEACFKAVGRALRDAIARKGLELPTTKGIL